MTLQECHPCFVYTVHKYHFSTRIREKISTTTHVRVPEGAEAQDRIETLRTRVPLGHEVGYEAFNHPLGRDPISLVKAHQSPIKIRRPTLIWH